MALTGVFGVLTLAFGRIFGGRPALLPIIPLVDAQFTNTATARTSLGDLMLAKADLSDFDCYVCHDKNKPPPLRFDDNKSSWCQKSIRIL